MLGNVTIGENSSIWYGASILAKSDPVVIGSLVSIGDKAVVTGKTQIGDSVTVGHGATLNGCTLQPNSSVEIGSEVGEGCVVESFSVVAAGSKLAPGTVVPSGEIWAGSPAEFVRVLTQEEKDSIPVSANNWYSLGQRHLASQNRSDEEQVVDHLKEEWAVYEESEEEIKKSHRF